MNSMNEIILLELVYKNSTENRAALLEMFMRLMDQSDLFVRLENLLNSNLFLGSEAGHLLQNAADMLNKVRGNPEDAIRNFMRLEDFIIQIEAWQRDSSEELAKTDYFLKSPTVVSKIDSVTYTGFYEQMYQMMTYITAVFHGVKGLKAWRRIPMGNFSDLIHFVNTELPEQFFSTERIKGKWYIVKQYFSGGVSGISYEGCKLVYEEALTTVEKTGGNHPYLREQNREDSGRLYEGIGYIVGVGLASVNDLFAGEIITEPDVKTAAVNPAVIDFEALRNPVKFLSTVLRTNRFILSPEQYVALLNKYYMNKTIMERRSGARCILCGNLLQGTGTDVCDAHFDFTQNTL